MTETISYRDKDNVFITADGYLFRNALAIFFSKKNAKKSANMIFEDNDWNNKSLINLKH